MIKLQPKWGRRKYSCRPRPFSRLFWSKIQPEPSGPLGQLEGISMIYRQNPLFRRCLSPRPLECSFRFGYFVLGLFWVLVVFVFLAISQHKWPGRMGIDGSYFGFWSFSCFWPFLPGQLAGISNIYRQNPLVFRVHFVFVFLEFQHLSPEPSCF